VRVRLRYADVGTFCEKFAPNVTRGGIFLASRDPRAVGTVLRFEVCLQDGTAVLAGEGRVTWVKAFNPAEPGKPHGMGVQFLSIEPASRPVLDRLLRVKELAGRRSTMSTPIVAPAAPPGSAASAAGTPAAAPARADERTAEAPPPTEFDRVEDSVLRRVVDRARLLSARTEDIEALLQKEEEPPASLSEALAEMPRFLANGRRSSGFFRAIPEPTPATASGPVPRGDGGDKPSG
jgi:uncharacterized protein (TIGR02266 family)